MDTRHIRTRVDLVETSAGDDEVSWFSVLWPSGSCLWMMLCDTKGTTVNLSTRAKGKRIIGSYEIQNILQQDCLDGGR